MATAFYNNYKKRRNATKPGFQRFNRVLIWQEKEMKDGSEEKMMPIILVASVACNKFGVNRPKQTKVIERKLNFYF